MATNKKYAAGGAPFTAHGVVFDGIGNDYMSRSSIIGQADGDKFTMSMWIWMSSAHTPFLFGNYDNAGLDTRCVGIPISGGDFLISVKNDSGTIWSTTSPAGMGTGRWDHILVSRSGTTGHVWVNDADAVPPAQPIAGDTGFDEGDWMFGARPDGSLGFNGEAAECYFSNEYLDISQESNRRKFIDASGDPVSLGADGSTPTGTQPWIYFSGEAADWNDGTAQKGSGGNFTMTGAVTDSTNEPIGLP